jgi:signal transduction histidine kinase
MASPYASSERFSDVHPPFDGVIARIEDAARRLADARDAGEREESLRSLEAQLDELREAAPADGIEALCTFLQSRGESERAGLARELHDNLGGILTPAKMDVAWLRARLGAESQFTERIARLDGLIDQAIDVKRRIIETLRPSLLDHLGLAAALQWYVEEASAKAGISPHLAIDPRLGRLPGPIEIASFRLAQEAIDNTVKHARATRIEIAIDRYADGVHIVISDDGVGIDDVAAAQRLSHGLAAMRHRVRALGGRLELRSLAGEGTRLAITIPLSGGASIAG